MRRQMVMLFVLLLAVSGCATTRSARKDNPELRMVNIIAVGGRHCH
ncbi:MAG: hypothetical protein HZA29_03745 [Candidatus Omnitrophica bacterium]|nr:hypothetical protein [Candidatus Omnitrophota bacterium]